MTPGSSLAGAPPAVLQETPPPNRRRGYTYFLVANAIAFVLAGTVFGVVWYGGVLSRWIVSAYEFFFGHPALAVAAAMSPLFMTLLIGYAYGRRAAARRKAEAARTTAQVGVGRVD